LIVARVVEELFVSAKAAEYSIVVQYSGREAKLKIHLKPF
jgi:hypothetical protein